VQHRIGYLLLDSFLILYYGIHGGIKKFYKLEPKEEHPATLDHIVSGVAG